MENSERPSETKIEGRQQQTPPQTERREKSEKKDKLDYLRKEPPPGDRTRYEPSPESSHRRWYTAAVANDTAAVKDGIGFAPYVNALATLITHPDTSTPLSIGIYGRWGAGKTSFMRQVEQRLREAFGAQPSRDRLCTAWFEAWKYHNSAELSSALMSTALDALERQATVLQRLRFRFKSAFSSFKLTSALWNAGLIGAAAYFMQYEAQWKMLSALPIVGMLFSQSSREFFNRLGLPLGINAQSLTQTPVELSQAVNLDNFSSQLSYYVESILGKDGRLVIFIDDLDRCSPQHVVSVLETLNVLMDSSRCIFLLGIDQQKIINSIETHYQRIADKHNVAGQTISFGNAFLEKMVQLPMQLPRANDQELLAWIGVMMAHTAEEQGKVESTVSETMETANIEYDEELQILVRELLLFRKPRSPRLIKRYLNRLRFLFVLVKSNPALYSQIDERYLAVWLLLHENHRDDILWQINTRQTATWQSVWSKNSVAVAATFDELSKNREIVKLLPDLLLKKQSNDAIAAYLTLTCI